MSISLVERLRTYPVFQQIEKLRRAKREKQARSAISKRYQGQGVKESVVNLLAISDNLLTNYSSRSWTLHTLERIPENFRRIRKDNPYSYALNQISSDLDHVINELAMDVAYRREPVDEMIADLNRGIESSIKSFQTTYSDQLAAFSQWLVQQKLVEASQS